MVQFEQDEYKSMQVTCTWPRSTHWIERHDPDRECGWAHPVWDQALMVEHAKQHLERRNADGKAVLSIPMQDNDAGAATIRDYLIALVACVWEDGEGFSGKRPFGNSGWNHDLYEALARAGAIESTVDEYGYYDYDVEQARRLIDEAIKAMRDAA